MDFVAALEEYLCDVASDLVLREAAGFILFTVFSRFRAGDAARITKEPHRHEEGPVQTKLRAHARHSEASVGLRTSTDADEAHGEEAREARFSGPATACFATSGGARPLHRAATHRTGLRADDALR